MFNLLIQKQNRKKKRNDGAVEMKENEGRKKRLIYQMTTIELEPVKTK